MSKRGAGQQLTKDGGRSDDEDEIDPGQRSEPLAPVEGRQIRGLPKRKGLGGAAAPSPAAPAAPTFGSAPPATGGAFSGFSFAKPPAAATTPSFGFGNTSSPATSEAAKPTFSFGSAQPSASPATPAAPATSSPFGGFSFGKPAATAPASAAVTVDAASAKATDSTQPASAPKPFGNFSFGSSSTPPAMATNTKAASTSEPSKPSFAASGFSFASAASQKPSHTPESLAAPISEQPSPAAATSSTQSHVPAGPSSQTSEAAAMANGHASLKPTQETQPDSGEVSYWTSLRGLNVSILNFLTAELAKDPFLDLGFYLPSLMAQYEIHLAEAAATAGWHPPEPETTEGDESATATNAPEPNGAASVPRSFNPAPPATTPLSATSQTPPSQANASPMPSFSFGASASTSTPKKPSAQVNALVKEVLDGKPEEAAEPTSTPKPTFSFGTPAADSKKSSTMFSFAPSGPLHPAMPESKTFSPSANLEKPDTAASSPSQLGKFGPGGSQPQLAFGGARVPSSSSSPAAVKQFSFGFGGASGSSPAPSTSATSAPTFSFGAKPSGAPSFSFGGSSQPAATGTDAAKPSFSFGGSSNSPFAPALSFGGTSTPASGETSEAPSGDEKAEASTEPQEPSKNLADSTGAGEEGEETVTEARAKLYRFADGSQKLEGLGVFRVKKSTKGDGKKRLLMRTDGGGNVILNMSLSADMNLTQEGPHAKFVGFDKDGKAAAYTLRVKNAESAAQLVDVIKKELE